MMPNLFVRLVCLSGDLLVGFRITFSLNSFRKIIHYVGHELGISIKRGYLRNISVIFEVDGYFTHAFIR